MVLIPISNWGYASFMGKRQTYWKRNWMRLQMEFFYDIGGAKLVECFEYLKSSCLDVFAYCFMLSTDVWKFDKPNSNWKEVIRNGNEIIGCK